MVNRCLRLGKAAIRAALRSSQVLVVRSEGGEAWTKIGCFRGLPFALEVEVVAIPPTEKEFRKKYKEKKEIEQALS